MGRFATITGRPRTSPSGVVWRQEMPPGSSHDRMRLTGPTAGIASAGPALPVWNRGRVPGGRRPLVGRASRRACVRASQIEVRVLSRCPRVMRPALMNGCRRAVVRRLGTPGRCRRPPMCIGVHRPHRRRRPEDCVRRLLVRRPATRRGCRRAARGYDRPGWGCPGCSRDVDGDRLPPAPDLPHASPRLPT